MPSHETILRIAKLLAGATNSESPEATAKLKGAYSRMVRDGVSFRDLLSLPITELYQDTLNKLVGVILDDQPSLSPSSRREAYSAYMLLIVGRFSGGWDGQGDFGGSSQQPGGRAGQGSGQSSQHTSREDAAREYEERRQAEEAARARTRSNQEHGSTGDSGRNTSGQSSNADKKPFKSNNGNTAKSANSKSFTLGRYSFRFSVDGFLAATQRIFGRGSILWHTLHDPMRGMRLFGASLLFGVAVASILLVMAGVVHTLTNTKPLWDIQLKNAFAFLTACGFLWKARLLHLGGWFR
jgi:hypothetical protein